MVRIHSIALPYHSAEGCGDLEHWLIVNLVNQTFKLMLKMIEQTNIPALLLGRACCPSLKPVRGLNWHFVWQLAFNVSFRHTERETNYDDRNWGMCMQACCLLTFAFSLKRSCTNSVLKEPQSWQYMHKQALILLWKCLCDLQLLSLIWEHSTASLHTSAGIATTLSANDIFPC